MIRIHLFTNYYYLYLIDNHGGKYSAHPSFHQEAIPRVVQGKIIQNSQQQCCLYSYHNYTYYPYTRITPHPRPSMPPHPNC